MIAKTLLIGYIAFSGGLLSNGAFGGGTVGVSGVRNISGWKTGTGVYQLRVGGLTLTGASTPAQADNGWSRSLGNTRVIVTAFGAILPTSYALTQVDDNTYNLATFVLGLAGDLSVQFSIETLAAF